MPWRSASELSRLRLKRPERLVRPDAKDTIFFFPDVCVRHVCTAFGFFPNPLDLLKFFSNPSDERVGVCVQLVNMACEYSV